MQLLWLVREPANLQILYPFIFLKAPKAKKKKVYGPSKPPSSKEDDADYASWLPPEGRLEFLNIVMIRRH